MFPPMIGEDLQLHLSATCLTLAVATSQTVATFVYTHGYMEPKTLHFALDIGLWVFSMQQLANSMVTNLVGLCGLLHSAY